MKSLNAVPTSVFYDQVDIKLYRGSNTIIWTLRDVMEACGNPFTSVRDIVHLVPTEHVFLFKVVVNKKIKKSYGVSQEGLISFLSSLDPKMFSKAPQFIQWLKQVLWPSAEWRTSILTRLYTNPQLYPSSMLSRPGYRLCEIKPTTPSLIPEAVAQVWNAASATVDIHEEQHHELEDQKFQQEVGKPAITKNDSAKASSGLLSERLQRFVVILKDLSKGIEELIAEVKAIEVDDTSKSIEVIVETKDVECPWSAIEGWLGLIIKKHFNRERKNVFTRLEFRQAVIAKLRNISLNLFGGSGRVFNEQVFRRFIDQVEAGTEGLDRYKKKQAPAPADLVLAKSEAAGFTPFVTGHSQEPFMEDSQ